MKYLVCVEGAERLYFAFSGRVAAESFANLPREGGQVATVLRGPAGLSGPALAPDLLAVAEENRAPGHVWPSLVEHPKGSPRPCLRCGGVFYSTGIANRICGKCRNRRH